MRVLIAHSRYRSTAPSGENRVVEQESRALAAAGHDVELFQRHSDEIGEWPLTSKAMVPLLSVRNPQVRSDLRAVLESFAPDVVHVHNTFPMLSSSVLLACQDVGVPVVATLHNYKLLCASGDLFRDGAPCHSCADGSVGPALLHGCYRGSRAATAVVAAGTRLNRSTWRRIVSAFVFISASQRELMTGLDLPADRVFVKHNFVEPGIDHDGPRQSVAYVGRLDAAKGVPLLMAAWDRFRETRPSSSLRLAIAGDGPLAGEVAAWAGHRLEVDLLGHLSSAEARGRVAKSLAVVVPSAWEETFGLVAVEAMASGVAPVAPARGSFPELVTDGRDGVLFRPGDTADLARVLAEVDESPQRFVDLGVAGRATHARRFSPETNVEELLEIYRFAVSHPAAADSSLQSALHERGGPT